MAACAGLGMYAKPTDRVSLSRPHACMLVRCGAAGRYSNVCSRLGLLLHQRHSVEVVPWLHGDSGYAIEAVAGAVLQSACQQ